jgi:hypothetical protein
MAIDYPAGKIRDASALTGYMRLSFKHLDVHIFIESLALCSGGHPRRIATNHNKLFFWLIPNLL